MPSWPPWLSCPGPRPAIDAVAEGRLREWTRTGNAHTLVLSPEGAAIEPDFGEETEAGLLPLADLREAVTRWIEFLDGGRGTESL